MAIIFDVMYEFQSFTFLSTEVNVTGVKFSMETWIITNKEYEWGFNTNIFW